MPRFDDRRDAGRQLAKRLQRFSGRADVVVVGLRVGALPVASEVARAIKAPLHTLDSSQLYGATVIVVDDGLASDADMALAVSALRLKHPARIVAAAPVGAADVCARLRCLADDCVLALAPFPLNSVGDWYTDFSVSEEVAVVTAPA